MYRPNRNGTRRSARGHIWRKELKKAKTRAGRRQRRGPEKGRTTQAKRSVWFLKGWSVVLNAAEVSRMHS